jgi:hypothetical protein
LAAILWQCVIMPATDLLLLLSKAPAILWQCVIMPATDLLLLLSKAPTVAEIKIPLCRERYYIVAL